MGSFTSIDTFLLQILIGETSMKQNDYFIPGITAIILALISPIYWIQQIISGSFNLSEGYVMDMTNIGFSNYLQTEHCGFLGS